MFRQVSTLAARTLKAGFGEKSQRTGMSRSMSYALPFSNNKMGSGSQSSGGIPDREALWERCGKDDRKFNALLKRYGDDSEGLKDIQELLDNVRKGWKDFTVTPKGEIKAWITPKGWEEVEKHEAEARRNSAY